MMRPMLRMRAVRKSFHSGVAGCCGAARALSHVDLDVCPGEIVAIVGRPGAGKTTLLLCAAGLLRPDGGVVERTGPVSYVSEATPSYAWMTVTDTVALIARRHGPDTIASALAATGLADYAGMPLRALSRDALARLRVACLLVTRPPLALLDATAPPAARLLLAAGVTVVLATREQTELATRVVDLSEGVTRPAVPRVAERRQ
jgi:ABC-type multidrug transport system ATPase subunit